MKKHIKTGIIGGSGFTGGELIRLLLNHDEAEISFVVSRSNSGKHICEVHHDLAGETDLEFTSSPGEADVVFLCLPHGESRKWLGENIFPAATKIIDLGNDFRVDNKFGNSVFVYGLPELNREKIKAAQYIANPGCFATAIQLALLPLVQSVPVTEAYVTGITGSTGAGQSLQESTGFNWRNNNVSAYKTLSHQHLAEINKTFSAVSECCPQIHFVPWRGNFTRGIFVSVVVSVKQTAGEIVEIYSEFYKNHPFVFVSGKPIDLKKAINTNKCIIQPEKINDKLVLHCAIDNLLKGASGQAVQNMNIMMGIEEEEGLKLKSIVY